MKSKLATWQLIRALDGITCALIVMIVVLAHPSVGRDELGNFDILCVAPIIAIAGFVHRIPLVLSDSGVWRRCVHSLRVTTLIFALLAPFSVWWLKAPKNCYLMVNSLLGCIAGIAVLMSLCAVINQVSVDTDLRYMKWESKLTSILTLYILFIPFVAFVLTFYIDSYILSVSNLGDFYDLIVLFPNWVRAVLLVPVLLSIGTLVHSRHLLVAYLVPELKPSRAGF